MADKVLASKDAEQSILGSVFFDESIIKTLSDKVFPDDFYYLRHKQIYEAMLYLFNSHEPIDSTTVINNLDNNGLLNECGGAEYIINLVESVPSVSNIETYIDIVKNKSVQRKVVQACSEIVSDSYKDMDDPKIYLDQVEKKIFEITSERTVKDLIPAKDILKDVYQKLVENSEKEGDIIGLDTGFKELNKKTLGFQNSDLIILAARPSMGKTALALNLATNVAKTGKYVAFFSLEMGLDQIVLRLISQTACVNQTSLKKGDFAKYNQDGWNKVNYAVSELSNYNLWLDDSGSTTIQDLRSICRKKKREGKLDFVVIDYLQLLSSRTNTNGNRVQEISDISRNLKEMARELKIPVLALSQLSRNAEQRKGTDSKKPIMSDLRESGSIEQDADIVMFIYRDDYYTKEKSEKPKIAEISIAKNRNGMIGDFDLLFEAQYTAFFDLDNSDKRSEE